MFRLLNFCRIGFRAWHKWMSCLFLVWRNYYRPRKETLGWKRWKWGYSYRWLKKKKLFPSRCLSLFISFPSILKSQCMYFNISSALFLPTSSLHTCPLALPEQIGVSVNCCSYREKLARNDKNSIYRAVPGEEEMVEARVSDGPNWCRWTSEGQDRIDG